jgi:hypothetical protein
MDEGVWPPTFYPPGLLSVGSLYPTSMRIGEEGRLAVNFKTEAQFHGLFVLSHPGKPHCPWAATAHRTTSLYPHRSQQVSRIAWKAFISYESHMSNYVLNAWSSFTGLLPYGKLPPYRHSEKDSSPEYMDKRTGLGIF